MSFKHLAADTLRCLRIGMASIALFQFAVGASLASAGQDDAKPQAENQNRNQNQPSRRKQHLLIRNISKSNERCRICYDNLRIAQSNERDEQADPGSRPMLQAIRNVVNDVFAHIRERQH